VTGEPGLMARGIRRGPQPRTKPLAAYWLYRALPPELTHP